MMRDELRALIDQLRLHGMAEALDAELARAEREAIAGKRGKSVGNPSFFSCADSARSTLCIMCRRPPPFPR